MDEEKGQLTTKEDRGVGSIKWDVYSRYFSNSAKVFDHRDPDVINASNEEQKSTTSMSGIMLIILELFLLIAAQAFASGSDIWLSFWAEEDDTQRFPLRDDEWWIMIWSIIIAAMTITALLGAYLFGYLSLRAAKSVYEIIIFCITSSNVIF